MSKVQEDEELAVGANSRPEEMKGGLRSFSPELLANGSYNKKGVPPGDQRPAADRGFSSQVTSAEAANDFDQGIERAKQMPLFGNRWFIPSSSRNQLGP